MYFRRTRRLDCPLWMQQAILYEVDNDLLTPTASSYLKNTERLHSEAASKEKKLEAALTKFKDYPEVYDFYNKMYGISDVQPWRVSLDLARKIVQHYSSFLSMVPEEAKFTITSVISTSSWVPAHSDTRRLSSLTCVIQSPPAITQWYEPKAEVAALYQTNDSVKYKNCLNGCLVPSHAEFVTSICLRPWEMVLFDNNSFHSVENLQPGMKRLLFNIGFLNTTHDELEDIYDRWQAQNN